MSRFIQRIQPKSFCSLIAVGVLVAAPLPVLAHEVEVAGDVAGTWHVEPDHNPKAGEPTQVWVALTREGGTLLPFDQTNCTLGVYETPRVATDSPILQPAVQAINAEQYQGIPGATVTFPKTGIYELTLSCTPKTAEAFKPFEMTYDVVVASGNAASAAPQAVPSSVETANSQNSLETVSPVPPDRSSPLETVSPVPPDRPSPLETVSPVPPDNLPVTSSPAASPVATNPAQPLPGEDQPWIWVVAGAIVAVPLALSVGRLLTKR